MYDLRQYLLNMITQYSIKDIQLLYDINYKTFQDVIYRNNINDDIQKIRFIKAWNDIYKNKEAI